MRKIKLLDLVKNKVDNIQRDVNISTISLLDLN